MSTAAAAARASLPGERIRPIAGRARPGPGASARARARARELFLDEAHAFGCAETTFRVLKEAFELPDAEDVSPAMALNGGVAYRGGVCGALTGATLAVGTLAARSWPDRPQAKRAARRVVARVVDDFEARHGAIECRLLLGRDIRTAADHRAFIESGVWRETCMTQIEGVVGRLAALPSRRGWRPASHEEREGRPGDQEARTAE